MQIELIGASIIGSNTFRQELPGSFYDMISKHFDCVPLNHMIAQSSEERILYNIKKTTKMDLVIIFHSTPQFIYFPNFGRDYIHMSDKVIDDWDAPNSFRYVEAYKQNRRDVVTNLSVDTEPIEKSTIKDFMKFHFNKDVTTNRFHGALSMINDYVFSKKIPVIHVVDSLPEWFNFKSGIVDHNIWKIEKQYSESFNKSVNGITEEGNLKIFKILLKYIDLLINHKEYFENNTKVF